MLRVAVARRDRRLGRLLGDRADGGEPAYEIGWEMLPGSIRPRLRHAAAAALLLARLSRWRSHRYVYAYPTPENRGSNGICRKLGFELLGIEEAEYPKGVWSPHNIWRLDLSCALPPPA